MEIQARAEQAEFLLDYKKYFPEINIPEEVVSHYVTCFEYICKTMLEKI